MHEPKVIVIYKRNLIEPSTSGSVVDTSLADSRGRGWNWQLFLQLHPTGPQIINKKTVSTVKIPQVKGMEMKNLFFKKMNQPHTLQVHVTSMSTSVSSTFFRQNGSTNINYTRHFSSSEFILFLAKLFPHLCSCSGNWVMNDIVTIFFTKISFIMLFKMLVCDLLSFTIA